MKPVNEMIDELVTTIRRICREKDISITQMESDLGFSAGLISRWSKTKTSPSFDKIVSIMDYLNITYDELMSGLLLNKSMNNNSSRPSDKDICEKLLSDSKSGRMKWLEFRENIPFHITFENIFSDWMEYQSHIVYYSSFDSGYFFIALQYDDRKLKLRADLYMLAEDGFEPRIINAGKVYAIKLLKYADEYLYTEWEQKKSTDMESNYLAY